jgi:hypothetical protein
MALESRPSSTANNASVFMTDLTFPGQWPGCFPSAHDHRGPRGVMAVSTTAT